MSITFDEAWLPGFDGRSSTRQVYRDHELIGRVCRRREHEPGETIREWFMAERAADAVYESIAGEYATFEEALERVIFCGVEG